MNGTRALKWFKQFNLCASRKERKSRQAKTHIPGQGAVSQFKTTGSAHFG